MWTNNVERGRPDDILGMRTACSILCTLYTRSGYVIINAFPLQQWLHERASMLCYTYITWFSDFLTHSTRLYHTDYRINTFKTPLIQKWVKIRTTKY